MLLVTWVERRQAVADLISLCHCGFSWSPISIIIFKQLDTRQPQFALYLCLYFYIYLYLYFILHFFFLPFFKVKREGWCYHQPCQRAASAFYEFVFVSILYSIFNVFFIPFQSEKRRLILSSALPEGSLSLLCICVCICILYH